MQKKSPARNSLKSGFQTLIQVGKEDGGDDTESSRGLPHRPSHHPPHTLTFSPGTDTEPEIPHPMCSTPAWFSASLVHTAILSPLVRMLMTAPHTSGLCSSKLSPIRHSSWGQKGRMVRPPPESQGVLPLSWRPLTLPQPGLLQWGALPIPPHPSPSLPLPLLHPSGSTCCFQHLLSGCAGGQCLEPAEVTCRCSVSVWSGCNSQRHLLQIEEGPLGGPQVSMPLGPATNRAIQSKHIFSL